MDLSLSTKRRGYDIESLIGDKSRIDPKNGGFPENYTDSSGYRERATKQVLGE